MASPEIDKDFDNRVRSIETHLIKISTNLEHWVEHNRSQDKKFEAHQAEVKQALQDQSKETKEALTTITNKQEKLTAFMNKAVGIGAFLLVVIPLGLTSIDLFSASPNLNQMPTAEIRQN